MPGAPGPGVVLDTWPLIEHYEGNEPAAAQVDELLARRRPWPVMSAVTFAEVLYTLANLYGASAAEEETRQLRRLLRVATLDIRTAEVAAWVKHTYRMSLGDTFAAATAIRHGVELWTGDCELLCPDRVWAVRDLRPPEARTASQPGRRPNALAHLDQEDLAAFVAAPLAPRGPRRRRGSAGLER